MFFLAIRWRRQRDPTASMKKHMLRARYICSLARDPVIGRCGHNPRVRHGAVPRKGAYLAPQGRTFVRDKKEHNKDKKLHSSDEKLHNSYELDLSWQEAVDLQSEDEGDDGSEIYCFMDEDGNSIP